MTKEQSDKLKAAYVAKVTERVVLGNHASWGEEDSLAVIEELVGVMTSDDELTLEGFMCIRENVKNVVNPSAFAQVLEKLPLDHPRHIRRPKRGTGGTRGRGVE